MKRTADAIWRGSMREGEGSISTQSGVLKDSPYSFHTRFEDGAGTNPEELIAAAHAGCFTMAFSFALNGAKFVADEISTKATLTLDKQEDGFAITAVHLDMKAKVPNIDDKTFQEIAAKAKLGCPVSKVLKAEITLTATLTA
jgi:osmotically inducible protein OsmC